MIYWHQCTLRRLCQLTNILITFLCHRWGHTNEVVIYLFMKKKSKMEEKKDYRLQRKVWKEGRVAILS